MKPFRDKKRILWLGGIALLTLGLLAAAVILPATGPTPGTEGPDVRVPRMQNVPDERSPRMKLELEGEQEGSR